jgi:lipoate-protein ligase B
MEQHKKVKFQSLGVIDYQEAWDYQEKLHAEIVEIKLQNRKISPEETPKATPNYLLFCQHPHVYTLGKVESQNIYCWTTKVWRSIMLSILKSTEEEILLIMVTVSWWVIRFLI